MSTNIEEQHETTSINAENNCTSSLIRRRCGAEALSQNRFNFFSLKKCWICLRELALDESEQLSMQKYFVENKLNLLTTFNFNNNKTTNTNKNASNFIQLKLFMNKFVLSVCKCRKKLAHLNCFNNYIDQKQNGNINAEILCSKCNFKYEFEYPYNSENILFFLNKYSKFSSIIKGVFFFVKIIF